MSGIYIHIPFCKQACIYCNFHFKAGNQPTIQMSKAIASELFLRKDYLKGEEISTIYFGGGTPSILPIEEISHILESVFKNYKISSDPEITLEANPDDLNISKLKELYKAGINRLSIGVQSFDDNALKWMNRAHKSEQAVNSILDAQNIGFENISIDIITGIPVCKDNQHIRDLEKALSLNPIHLSCYTLTLEPNTSWDRLIKLKNYPKPKENKQAEAFNQTINLLESAGWIHYETSNFSKSPKWISRHNSSYWESKSYIGVGPSAHSYNGSSRRWNKIVHNNYIETINSGIQPPFEEEIITKSMAFNEAIMTGIRTYKGIDLKLLSSLLPDEADKIREKIQLEPLCNQVEIRDNFIKLKHNMQVFTDAVSVSLFVD